MNTRNLGIAGLVVAAALLSSTTASAACFYRGELRAETTIPQELHDADWAIRGRVLSSTNRWPDDAEEIWTTYTVEVLTAFKGTPPRTITYFTYSNSGGFYLSETEEYLLFLNRADDLPGDIATGAVINYSCGRSGPWDRLSAEEQAQLLPSIPAASSAGLR